MTITVKAENWTGEDVTVRVNQRTGEFTMWQDRGERYRLRPVAEEVWKVEQAQGAEWREVGTVFQMEERDFVATSAFSDLQRWGRCKFAAAVKMLCNT